MIIPHVIAIIILVSIVYAWSSLAPWAPTRIKDLKHVNKVVALKKDDVFLEMGCGNARVCSYIAKNNPEAKVIGIELALIFYLFSRFRAALFGPKNLKIVFGDALKYDLSKVDVIYTYALIKTLNHQIKDKLTREMKPGSRLVSYAFSLEEWEGEQESFKPEEKAPAIHLYIK